MLFRVGGQEIGRGRRYFEGVEFCNNLAHEIGTDAETLCGKLSVSFFCVKTKFFLTIFNFQGSVSVHVCSYQNCGECLLGSNALKPINVIQLMYVIDHPKA